MKQFIYLDTDIVNSKNEKKEKFTYKDMKPFYIIVLMSNSSSAFLDVSPAYIHNEQTTYDSGAKVTSLS